MKVVKLGGVSNFVLSLFAQNDHEQMRPFFLKQPYAYTHSPLVQKERVDTTGHELKTTIEYKIIFTFLVEVMITNGLICQNIRWLLFACNNIKLL